MSAISASQPEPSLTPVWTLQRSVGKPRPLTEPTLRLICGEIAASKSALTARSGQRFGLLAIP